MNVFDLRKRLIKDYSDYVHSFIRIRDKAIREKVERELNDGLLWPQPLIQLNPAFKVGRWIDDLVKEGILHDECRKIFRSRKNETNGEGMPLRLHQHQEDAVRTAKKNTNYVLTTGTGSGKSLAYVVPIVDHILRRGPGKGIQAIIIYPMNALANSQHGELEKFLCDGFPDRKGPISFGRYTGQEKQEQKQAIIANPPDILLTNYVMMELILTRPDEFPLIESAKGLRFLVLDELHTYRGRQGADVALLVRRVRDRLDAPDMLCVGTSATLAGVGSYDESRAEVAAVASRLFGGKVENENVIGETLRRATAELDFTRSSDKQDLIARISDPSKKSPIDHDDFIRDSLASWIESTVGVVTDTASTRLVRAKPRCIHGDTGAGAQLSELTGLDRGRCIEAIEECLLAGYNCLDPNTLFPVFAFRLHQFISRGDTVYSSLEDESERFTTVYGQKFVPTDRSKILLPLTFCRECGQEYYIVARHTNDDTTTFAPRERNESYEDDDIQSGFLYFSSERPWPDDMDAIIDLVPEEWTESPNGVTRLRSRYKNRLPQLVTVNPAGIESSDGRRMHFIPAPFNFCLCCGVSYGARQRSDFAKLATLSSEGRSTATTILTLSTVLNLKKETALQPRARKLLSFSDNRQDASLQSGHFNDFVEVGLLRAALAQACANAGSEGLSHEHLTLKVFDAINLPFELYASDPMWKFQAKAETERAFREVLGYRLYRDLRRGWRITLPNLEQCGLLEIDYLSLAEVCAAEELWQTGHPALVTATATTRMKIAKTLLDYMRRELAIKVDYLNPSYQESIRQLSSQRLRAPWSLDESERRMETASILFPSTKPKDDDFPGGRAYLSGHSGYGQYLRRPNTIDTYSDKLSIVETQEIIRQLLIALREGGLVEVITPVEKKNDIPGYQLVAGCLRWKAGDGKKTFHDPIRVPRASEEAAGTNPYFVNFYRSVALNAKGIEAREHTAQVPGEFREEREEQFREGKLPVLFCSPTMELGIDIAELNVVNMRNIPPTAANYAQRSGRAGRSGQPALVFSYCATGNSHDQYFFRRPELMVAGSVTPPRLDLANEDLVIAHLDAVWLAETGQSLYRTLAELLDLADPNLLLPLKPVVRDSFERELPRKNARRRTEAILATLHDQLAKAPWYTPRWVEERLAQCQLRFDRSCDRWRELYRAAKKQAQVQHGIIHDPTRSQEERKRAERLRQEAEAQLQILADSNNVYQSDFYSYRYFASEGFLPGYNFPRLPLSAFIPARRNIKDGYLSRPRFLAISEFGPRTVVYHEGSRYTINKVILPVGDRALLTTRVKICENCGYLHPMPEDVGPDLCVRCKTKLPAAKPNLFRLQNVSTKRRDKINADEEERLRMGFELRTAVRFSDSSGGLLCSTARVTVDGQCIARLHYGHASELWRINLGEKRRADPTKEGFTLDIENGYWVKEKRANDDDEDDEPTGPLTQRVVPFVADRRNCLLIEFTEVPSEAVMASMQSAIKNAIQVLHHLEDNELAAEPLPNKDDRRIIMLYEATEGGAGVLKQIIEDHKELNAIAKTALDLCHFDPESGADRKHAPHAKEDCNAACYDCLMTYGNQNDHPLLDRQQIKDMLSHFAVATVDSSPTALTREEHLAALSRLCDSKLEKSWLSILEERRGRLPSHAQHRVEACQTRPDFFYAEDQTAIYIDGPPHKYPDRQERDKTQTETMEDAGFTVIRFNGEDDWPAIFAKYPHVFGETK